MTPKAGLWTWHPKPNQQKNSQPTLLPTPHLLLSFTNGALKRHHHHHHPTRALYKECLRNHAATLGGHAIDGCGEFMPSPHSSPSDPTSLKCAACGCHRNFHRKSDDSDEEEEDDDDAAHFTPKRRNSSSPPHPLASAYSPSAPQMLLALSAGHSGPPPDADGNHHLHHHHSGNRPATPNATPAAVSKRFRTKFTREQKEKMYGFAERLGWKMQRQDEGMVEEFCREIGVGKGVLKVWMHNHKNSFTKRNSNSTSNVPESNHHTTNDNNDDNIHNTSNGNAADNNAVLNASSSSS